MAVVTIRGQLGSGADEVGQQLARKLHADYVDREIIAKVAEVLNKQPSDVVAKEMPPGSLMGRIAEALGRGYAPGTNYPGVYAPTWEIPLDDTQYLAGLRSIIKALAESKSIVIRGRGSQFILKDHPEAFHVLVVAPLGQRVERVMETMKLDEKAAKKEIDNIDKSRREFIKRYFQADLEDPVNYDLVINTENFSFEDAASIIVAALPFNKKNPGPGTRSQENR